ncbi:uncharacterized protein ccdc14 isoform X2 [Notolabrus celidotus]|uniref:uncharacterized protein ccdc14 isoform X2 n=1 Tax=Notolabrus celidotus TaxID=1203425 RepID=UPI001490437E|nr:uncharacterized protein ccdc14 isoform X2 [Notolabrus celidotus]
MKGTARAKVVTSGRLTGRVKVQTVKRRVPSNPAPEPAYSLYSTDSEEQVTSLHKGLDRCAALLGGILQVDKEETPPSVPGATQGAAAKSRPSPSRTIRKLAPQTDQKIRRSVHRGAASKTPKTPRQPVTAPAAHSGVKLHPPRRRLQTPQHLSQPSTPSSQPPAAARARGEVEQDVDESVPVRDTNPETSDAHTAVTNTHTCALKVQPEHAQCEEDSHSCREQTGGTQRTAQDVLGELRALIAGQGSVAETLLRHLEQTLSSSSSSSSLMKAGGADIQAEAEVSSLQSQNTQLHRRVRSLQQQLKQREDAERRQHTDSLSHSDVLILQDELAVAQSQLQELQCDLTELREALQDAQSRLRESEAQRTLIQTDLETTRCRFVESEREKTELASLAQKRLEEIQSLSSLQSRDSSVPPAVSDSQTSKQQQQKLDPAQPPSDRVTQYLMSLGQLEPTHTDQVCVSAERGGESENHRRQLFNASLSRVSLSSDWSTRSGSTFDTRDEAAFRDGLAALDASIASLQKTMQLDLRR